MFYTVGSCVVLLSLTSLERRPIKMPLRNSGFCSIRSQGERKTDIGHLFCCTSLSYSRRLSVFCCLCGVLTLESKSLLRTWRWAPKLVSFPDPTLCEPMQVVMWSQYSVYANNHDSWDCRTKIRRQCPQTLFSCAWWGLGTRLPYPQPLTWLIFYYGVCYLEIFYWPLDAELVIFRVLKQLHKH